MLTNGIIEPIWRAVLVEYLQEHTSVGRDVSVGGLPVCCIATILIDAGHVHIVDGIALVVCSGFVFSCDESCHVCLAVLCVEIAEVGVELTAESAIGGTDLDARQLEAYLVLEPAQSLLIVGELALLHIDFLFGSELPVVVDELILVAHQHLWCFVSAEHNVLYGCGNGCDDTVHGLGLGIEGECADGIDAILEHHLLDLVGILESVVVYHAHGTRVAFLIFITAVDHLRGCHVDRKGALGAEQHDAILGDRQELIGVSRVSFPRMLHGERGLDGLELLVEGVCLILVYQVLAHIERDILVHVCHHP